ncbi:hydroxymethylglutaryl-CoA lyase [Cupriavidus sp. WS]|uniref:hydroxymethylglutaryl-CoA lyase n=1 Tax=Cupriavidus sp. WS TaxID=1312922 RepID=UPI00036C5CC1|nr:hydroxymethylglutaryl-CoA lyase [Cupriavidus sp. WS]
MSDKVTIREVGLRDGLQIVKGFMPTDTKLAWIAAEHAAGVTEIEVCSFVPPRLIPQFADAEAVVNGALALPGLAATALIPNLKGAERGLALGVHKLNYVMSVSERHNLANVRRSTQESLDDFRRIVALVRDSQVPRRPKVVGGLSTAFGCTLEGRVSEARVVELAVALVRAGADELTIADTVGYGDPAGVRRVFKAVLDNVGDIPVAAHFHDTRGLGIANALAAADTGIRAFDASLAGLGGCPHAPGATGNVVTEDLAFLFESMGLATGIDLNQLLQVRKIIEASLPDEPLSGGLARAGLPRGFGGHALAA